MGRVDVEPLARLRLGPAAIDAPARKNQSMRAVAIDHGELKIAVERRAGNGLPHLNDHAAADESGIDLDQNASVIPPTEAACSGFDLDQMRRGVVIESITYDRFAPAPAFDPSLPALRRCHAGQQIAREPRGIRHLPLSNLPDHDLGEAAAAAGRPVVPKAGSSRRPGWNFSAHM